MTISTLDSFTVYCDSSLEVTDLECYCDSLSIEPVAGYPGAYDLIAQPDIDDTVVAQLRNKLVSDPQILDFEENHNDFYSDDESAEPAGLVDDMTAGDYLWHHKVMNIEAAWNLTANGQNEKGDGVVIAHPDTGYIRHPELTDGDGRILTDKALDLVDEDYYPGYLKATHGLGTASVILGNDTGLIKGIAPAASLVPIRVAKVKKIVPSPVLFGGGMRRLRKAIEHAIEVRADIVSISLGGLRSLTQSRALKEALQRAKSKGIIVMAAAGNWVGFVVYPAKYDEVIAVSASNYANRPWRGSSQGESVIITAPGENVWKADTKADNKVLRSSGTSYAVANCAGVAALWLAHWGREQLAEILGGEDKLVDGFVRMLEASASTDHELPDEGFGAGIIDAERLLSLNPADFVD